MDHDANQISLGNDPELIQDFVVEAREHLANVETQLLVFEQEGTASDAVHSVFRSFHTIKGLAGFLDLHTIQRTAHQIETLLDETRNGHIQVSPEITDVILTGADFLNKAVASLEAGLQGRPSQNVPADEQLLARIQHILDAATAPSSGSGEAPPAAAASAVPVEADQQPQPEAAPAPNATTNTPARDFVVRVDTEKIDKMFELVGEMVIAHALVVHDPALQIARNTTLARNVGQLTRVIAEMQTIAMSMRVVQVEELFRRMQRVVRDSARRASKNVVLVTEGGETELDRTIVQELADPLMHMIRNAIDHGIETPEERRLAGKSDSARVTLRAAHQGGQVVLEVSDDGRGLNLEKIRSRAVERGLVDSAAVLSEAETANLIFAPGFSTAEVVTELSGRGVGMDVVQKQIHKLRGRVEIHTRRGEGTTFMLRLPLTLAIIDGLLVRVGVERYVLPITSVRELIRPREEDVCAVEAQREIAMIRGEPLPIVRLHERFGVRPSFTNAWDALLVVAETERARFCLMVDEMLGKQEVVIKNLGNFFGAVAGVSGGAILGDGRVGLIVDLDSVFAPAQKGNAVAA